MPSDLISIARSGAQAAKIALEVTAQNIANASSAGYVRRTVRLEEMASAGGLGRIGDVSLSGVRLDGIIRHADVFRQAEARRTGADAARAGAEVAGLENIEAAIEQSNVYPSMVGFESALQQLAADPVDPSLRSAVVEEARTLTRTMNIASAGLDAAGNALRAEAADGVSQVNLLTGELARINLRLARASDASSDQTALLDQRDSLLQQLSAHAGITATIAPDETVEVRLGGSAGPQLVMGGSATPLAMNTAANGTIGFTLGGNPATVDTGELAGKAQALIKLDGVRTSLDGIAAGIVATVNAAQANGAALDGSAGQPLFSGTGAASIALAFEDGALIATAPAGAGAGSRDPGNLSALRSALAAADPTGATDALLLDISGMVAGRKVTRDALDSIANGARIALEAQSGVDLDQEAINLIRFQQAFQASGRAIQVANTLFDTLLAIR